MSLQRYNAIRMRRLFACCAALLVATVAYAQKPVLAWSDRTGAGLDFVAGTAAGSDGSVYFAAVTGSGTFFSPIFGNYHIATGNLSPDGATACSAMVGGSADDIAYAMSLFPDGTLLV